MRGTTTVPAAGQKADVPGIAVLTGARPGVSQLHVSRLSEGLLPA